MSLSQVSQLTPLQKLIQDKLQCLVRARSMPAGTPLGDAPWPAKAGHCFLDFVQAGWAERQRLMNLSQQLMIVRGSSADLSTAQWEREALTLQTFPPGAGSIFHTHILCWEFSRRSFWKVFVPDSDTVGIAMAIAADRFREAGAVLPCASLWRRH